MRLHPAIGLIPVLLAGCLVAPVHGPATSSPLVGHASNMLANATEPADLTAPVFKLLGVVAKGGPIYGAGEPSIVAGLDGTLYVSFPGCDRGPYYLAPSLPSQETCAHGLVYASRDDGATWTRLNKAGTGRLSEDGPAANGDADVTVDAAGNVYASSLGGRGIQVFRSEDAGTTWAWAGNVVPPNDANPSQPGSADRNWMAASDPGHLILTWMGAGKGHPRSVAINTTFDGGRTWIGTTFVSHDIGWLGSVQFAPDGQTAYIPFTVGPATLVPTGPYTQYFVLHVAATNDGGQTWTDLDTKISIPASPAGGHFSGLLMAPALDVTGDGHIVYAWSQEVLDPTGRVEIGSVVKYSASADQGATWSAPVPLTTTPNAIMPWVAGGAGDRFAITMFTSTVPGYPDTAPGKWELDAVVVDSAGSSAAKVVRSVVDPNIHIGSICTKGSGCGAPAPVFDRELLDYFECDVTPDGQVVVVYPADDATKGKEIEIRTAIQTGGTPLLVR